MPGPRILILSSRTGGGHSRVAQTLRERLLSLEPSSEIAIVDGLERTDFGLRVDPARVFLTLTTRFIRLYNLGYRATNGARSVEAFRRIIRLLFGRSLAQVLREHAPDLVVSTHHFLSPATVAAGANPLPPFVMVGSDLGQPHRLWFDPRLHAVYVPSDDMVAYAQRCLGPNSETRVYMLGFPIESTPMRAGRPTDWAGRLLVMGGGAGTGSVDRVVDVLSRGFPQHQITVVCGHNAALQRTVAGWRRSNVEALGFVNNVAELMAGSDMVISKAGPVTIMEAATAGRPLIITSWVGMQERDNVEFVVNNRLGLYEPSLGALCDAVRHVYDRWHEFVAVSPPHVDRGPEQIAQHVLDLSRRLVTRQDSATVIS